VKSSRPGRDSAWLAFKYDDEHAQRDGVLLPTKFDPYGRVTRAVYQSCLAEAAGAESKADLLVAEIWREFNRGTIHDDIRVLKRSGKVFWLVPNELGGSTLMFPEEY
jgi:hypothetical protein